MLVSSLEMFDQIWGSHAMTAWKAEAVCVCV